MIEIKGNIFDFLEDDKTQAICITTNGMVGADGQNTMGAGCAGEAAKRWSGIRKNAGTIIANLGNVPGLIGIINKEGLFVNPDRELVKSREYKKLIFSFPTKDDFRYPSDIDLIERSAMKVLAFADKLDLTKVALSAPGCGCGKLDWETGVKPRIKSILDDRFYIVFLDKT